MPANRPTLKTARPRAILTIPELEHAKAAALGSLVSLHSRRAYKNAIDKFIAWYCSEPRLGFNRAVVLRYRSFLESLSLSAATINLHLSAIRRPADEATESSMLSPELAIGIRRVKGVKRLGRRIGNWLSGDQAQDLLNSIPQSTLRGRRDAAMIGLLLGCGLRRSEAVALRLDQTQLREGHWVVADLYGKGGRLRTVPIPGWSKALIDRWSAGVCPCGCSCLLMLDAELHRSLTFWTLSSSLCAPHADPSEPHPALPFLLRRVLDSLSVIRIAAARPNLNTFVRYLSATKHRCIHTVWGEE